MVIISHRLPSEMVLQFPSVLEAREFLDGQRKLCPVRLADYTSFLCAARQACLAGIDGDLRASFQNEWMGGPITTVLYSLAYYCLGLRAIQDLWMESFAAVGLLDELLSVVGMIPWGYSQEGGHPNEAWDEIHALLRHLLLERSFTAYDERIPGYTAERLEVWSQLLSHYEDSYPLG